VDAVRISSPWPSAIAQDQARLNGDDVPPTQARAGKPTIRCVNLGRGIEPLRLTVRVAAGVLQDAQPTHPQDLFGAFDEDMLLD